MNGNIPWDAHFAMALQHNTPDHPNASTADALQQPSELEALQPRRRKTSTTIRLDVDVLEWLREPGPGYQSRINAILRREMLRARKP